jgi:hypothetical protein
VASETVTVYLDGEPTLDDLATALDALRDMLSGLADTPEQAAISWTVDALERSSALATFRGVATNPQDVVHVTDRYLQTARAIQSGASIDKRVAPATQKLLGLLNGRMPHFRLETADDDVTISTQTAPPAVVVENITSLPVTFGAVEGRIQTLSNRGSLHFTLFDLVRDKAVSCYLQEGQQELMRDAWGRIAIVEGRIKRDLETGRPQTIRQVRRVTFVQEGHRGDWRRAEGALRGVGDPEPAEDTIRRLRDAQ